MTRVLFLPGWGFKATVFDPLMETLGDAFQFDSVESAGYGDINALTDDLIDHACAADVIVGWSLGGLVAIQLALHEPQHVNRLVLLATTPCFTQRSDWGAGMPGDVFNDFMQLAMNDPVMGLRQFVRLNSGARVNPVSRKLLGDNTIEPGHEALMAGLDTLQQTDLRKALPSLSAKVLVMQAGDDRLISLAAGHYLSRQSEGSQLAEFDCGGHAFFLEQTDDVAGVIQQWL